MNCLLVYMTAADKAEAEKVGKHLVEKRLAACVNIVDTIDSLFWWDGGVQSEQETAFVAKTTESRMPALIDEVKRVHSYDVPCIVAVPIVSGNPDFLKWIEEETSPDAGDR